LDERVKIRFVDALQPFPLSGSDCDCRQSPAIDQSLNSCA
jgi:hypothetical protein